MTAKRTTGKGAPSGASAPPPPDSCAAISSDEPALKTFCDGVAVESGEFDGLLGQFDKHASVVLRDMFTDLRAYLLTYCGNDDAKARQLLADHEPQPGFRNVTPVSEDIVLVLRLLSGIRSAWRCEPGRFDELILGKGNAQKLAGSKKGGATTAKHKKAASSQQHAAWIAAADELRRAGRAEHELAGILSSRFGVTARQVRSVVKKRK